MAEIAFVLFYALGIWITAFLLGNAELGGVGEMDEFEWIMVFLWPLTLLFVLMWGIWFCSIWLWGCIPKGIEGVLGRVGGVVFNPYRLGGEFREWRTSRRQKQSQAEKESVDCGGSAS